MGILFLPSVRDRAPSSALLMVPAFALLSFVALVVPVDALQTNVGGKATSKEAAARSKPVVEAAATADHLNSNSVQCLLDEPVLECNLRRTVDGPWSEAWTRYVLLRPGMSFRELKAATKKRNEFRLSERVPGTLRTVVLVHVICFAAALPAVLSSDAVFPKLLELAVAGRVAAGI